MSKPLGLRDEGRILGEAIRVHYGRRARLLRWRLHELLGRGGISLITGMTSLAASEIARGGWVALHGRAIHGLARA